MLSGVFYNPGKNINLLFVGVVLLVNPPAESDHRFFLTFYGQ